MKHLLAQNDNWGLHWFRRDLRISGNLALKKNYETNQGRVLGIFCFDSIFLSRKDFSNNRFGFFLKTLKHLKNEMQQMGGDLWVIDANPLIAFPHLIDLLQKNKKNLPRCVTWCRDYEPFARQRDEKIEELLQSKAISVLTERDHLLIEPWEIQKEDSTFYQVFTPFSRKWFEKIKAPYFRDRIYAHDSQKTPMSFHFRWQDLLPQNKLKDSLDDFIAKNQPYETISIPQAGADAAKLALKKFKNKLPDYSTQRDWPWKQGTSQISLFLKNGSLTSAQVLSFLDLEKSQSQYVKEIIWREFYYSILYHRPDVETSCFLKKYNQLSWENNRTWFERWCEGTTGFPIVDAGMRQLRQTGWMHNRVRMIVASFLVKDLLIDWRWGENYFMKTLLDGDLAPNNGGWQWAASTGCDPQPYFRIFNPWLQAEKFDPEAQYIKQYLPELQKATVKEIHNPEADRSIYKYPVPMVNHRVQKEKAILLFKKL